MCALLRGDGIPVLDPSALTMGGAPRAVSKHIAKKPASVMKKPMAQVVDESSGGEDEEDKLEGGGQVAERGGREAGDGAHDDEEARDGAHDGGEARDGAQDGEEARDDGAQDGEEARGEDGAEDGAKDGEEAGAEDGAKDGEEARGDDGAQDGGSGALEEPANEDEECEEEDAEQANEEEQEEEIKDDDLRPSRSKNRGPFDAQGEEAKKQRRGSKAEKRTKSKHEDVVQEESQRKRVRRRSKKDEVEEEEQRKRMRTKSKHVNEVHAEAKRKKVRRKSKEVGESDAAAKRKRVRRRSKSKADVEPEEPVATGKKRRRGGVRKRPAAKSEVRDRSKSKKFTDLFSTLPGEVQSWFNSLKTRAEETSYINEVVVRKDGRLNIDYKVLIKTMMQRQESQGKSDKLRGYMFEEALAKLGGSQRALDDALAAHRVLKRNKGGMDVYFFPKLEFSKASLMTHDVSGEMKKHAEENVFQDMLKDQMGFQWEPLADAGTGGSSSLLALPGFEEGDDAGNLPIGPPQPPSSEDIRDLTALLSEMSRQQGIALKLIQSGESSMAKGGIAKGDTEVIEVNIQQMRKAAEESEEVSRTISKAIKFSRLEWEGGFSLENCKILSEQASSLARRLCTCSKLLRAILPQGSRS